MLFRSFAGNLKELAKKLPYLKEQKLTYLHLMPLLQMPHPHNDGGYAVEDFDTVDPALGTNKDLENLTRELRKAGISLCLDFVIDLPSTRTSWNGCSWNCTTTGKGWKFWSGRWQKPTTPAVPS